MSIVENSISMPDGLSPVAWHKSTPSVLRRSAWIGGESDGWNAWKRILRKRKKRIDPVLPWGEGDPIGTSLTTDGVEAWLADVQNRELNLNDALAALAWCRRLPELCDALTLDLWWTLWDWLVRAAVEADLTPSDNDSTRESAILRQLLAGELALTLACLFPEIKNCRKLLPASRRVLACGLADLLDGKGLPHAKHYDRFQTLLACWTRCRTLGGHLKNGCWNGKSEKQFRQFLRGSLRLIRRDGALAFSGPMVRHDAAPVLSAAVALCGKKPEQTLAQLTLPGEKKRCGKSGCELPAAKVHSEWAATAVLRPDWKRTAPRLTVLYPDQSCRVELAVGSDILMSGLWRFEVQMDGQTVDPASDWSEMCWVSDEDVDYLELQMDLGKGLRVERHLLLARKDRFLFLADAVLGSQPAKLDYRGLFPICPEITYRETHETRQGTMTGRKPRTAVLPLALPQMLSKRVNGGLAATGEGLQLSQTADARSIFAPVFFGLGAKRCEKPHLWRQLTVAESWAIQPNDVAVGYRIALGRRQWLIYRSLAQTGNRSVLGHNISNEMLVARFDRRGEVEPLIEIEQE